MLFRNEIRSRYRVVAKVQTISLADAKAKNLFGPVWHGTSAETHEKIEREGFKVFIGQERQGEIVNGYPASDYHDGIPAPIHHMGFGVYFTTKKAIAKQYNHGTVKGLKTYYLDVPRLETINFGAPRTMMKWWQQNGYDMKSVFPQTSYRTDAIERMRLDATRHLTDSLKSRFDAVWFKGQGLRRHLDGDQICVFDPDRIYEIDLSLSQEGEPGSRVRRLADGMIGTILDEKGVSELRDHWKSRSGDTPHPWLKPGTTKTYTIKWQKGGTGRQVQDVDVEPYTRKTV